MSQIKKINIKGVEYDLAGSGNSTTDTAYVDNKTLYIEEGTTGGGGSTPIVEKVLLVNEEQTEAILETPITQEEFDLLASSENSILKVALKYADGDVSDGGYLLKCIMSTVIEQKIPALGFGMTIVESASQGVAYIQSIMVSIINYSGIEIITTALIDMAPLGGNNNTPIVLNLEFTQEEVNSTSIQRDLTIGDDISQEDFNTLTTDGEHKVLINYSFTNNGIIFKEFVYATGYSGVMESGQLTADMFIAQQVLPHWFGMTESDNIHVFTSLMISIGIFDGSNMARITFERIN